MQLTGDPITFVTASTDAAVALLSIVVCADLAAIARRRRIPAVRCGWIGVFASLAAATALGAVIHGVEMGPTALATLWFLVYPSVSAGVASMAIAAVVDLAGDDAVGAVSKPLIASSTGVLVLTLVLPQRFELLMAYELLGTVFALGLSTTRWRRTRTPEAGRIAFGLALTVVAAMVELSPLAIRALALDHNGLFHVVQFGGAVLVGAGARRQFNSYAAPLAAPARAESAG